MLLTFDTSSIIYAWDNYPLEIFPPLWEWVGDQVSQHTFVMSEVAFEETKNKWPECAEWLDRQDICQIKMTDKILQEANRIKGLLGIIEDNYGKGVGENDLLIIATAQTSRSQLVTNEGRQNNLPDSPAKYKIPAVCKLETVDVHCIDFITLIKRSNEVFSG